MRLPQSIDRRELVFSFAMLALASLGIPCAHAELTWGQKTVELQATAGTEVLEAHFLFTNTGPAPVDIRQVESSCGCTTTELSERHYEPGKSGEIVARYTTAGHMGFQKKTIAVFTSSQPEPATLTLIVHIPEIMSIQPAFVTWAHDESTKPKVITLELLQDTPLKDIAVQSSNAAVGVALQPIVKDRKYLLTVTPAQTGQFVHAILTVHCLFGSKEQTFRTYATVQPPLSRQ